jgi:tol-pal system protein YbgF
MTRICNDGSHVARAGITGVATAIFLAVLAVVAPAAPAAAQNAQTQELVNRIERLQQELNTLQQYVYRGSAPSGSGGSTTLPPAGAVDAGNPASVARLSVRISQLESEIQRLTGQNEEFGHSIRQMQARLDKLVNDVDARLSAIERRAGGAPADSAASAASPAPAGRPPTAQAASGGATSGGTAPGPQVLGQLRVDPATGEPVGGAAAPAPAPQQAAAPAETPEQLYSRAQTLLLKEQNVAEAERLLREFLDKYPNHALAANAHYWLGRTYFVRKDYQQAAFTFAEAFQKYPKSDKAPANLLNLGMSLQQLGKIKEACTAYSRLLQNFPKAEDAVKRRAISERQRAKCG